MKKIGLAIAATALTATAFAAPLKTQPQKLSYAMGFETGKAFLMHDITVQPKQYAEGLGDALSKATPKLSAKQIAAVMKQFEAAQIKKLQAKEANASKTNVSAGAKFLAENAKKPGVKTLANGLQYKVITKGHGAHPKGNSTVVVNYSGSLIDGTVFDSSYKRGTPATFGVNQVIPGWTQALQMMRPGSVWMLYIPAKLGYGTRGAPPKIGPNATLIFKVDLIKVK